MIFEQVMASLEIPATDKDVAKIILNFFLYQYQRSLEKKINTNQELRAYKAANKAAQEEYNKDPELGGVGWDRNLPYNENTIKYKEEETKKAEKEFMEMARTLEFVKDRFVEKFV